MEMLPTLANTILVAFVGVLVVYVTRVQVAMKQDIRDLRQETNEGFREVAAEFRQVRSEIASLRSDLTQVALALRARPQTG